MEKKLEEMRKALERAENIAYVYGQLKDRMQWDTMQLTDQTDEEGNSIFKAPEEGEWQYERYCAYMEVLAVVEKMIK